MTCTKCRLHLTCKRVQIPGRGSEKARIVFVGQAPGRDEDDRGQCFVGPAGQLLTQAIQEYNLKPSFITNVVRCFPPGDRDPKSDEIAACLPYLKEEIKRLQPEYIVTLGNVPLKALTGKTGVSTYSGTVVREVGKTKIFSLFHPSFILRYPGNLSRFEMHLRGLVRLLNDHKKTEYCVRSVSPDQARSLLIKEKKLVVFDYETSGKAKQYGGWIRMVGFFAAGQAFTVSVEGDPKGARQLMLWFLQTPVRKAAYNMVFETRWSFEEYGQEPRNLMADPYLMQYLLDENSLNDLESVASQYLKVESWDVAPEMLKNGWGYDTIPLSKLQPYCGIDCIHENSLVSELAQKLDEGQRYVYSKILVPLAALCARMETRGIKIDAQWAAKRDQEFGIEQAFDYNAMNKMDVVQAMTKAKLLKNKKFMFNPASSDQIRDIVFSRLEFKSKVRTKGGSLSADQDVMTQFKGQHPFFDSYLKWKSTNTMRNNFLQKFPEFMDKDGLVHPSYKPIGTVTGRLSSKEPPAQTFDNDPKVRGMLVSRFPKGKILSNDYSQLEMRLVASESNEKKLIDIFAKGEDPHNYTAAEMFGKEFTKDDRKIAKNINFGTVYGVTEYTLSKDFNIPIPIAVEWLHRHRNTYPNIYVWMSRQHDYVKQHGFIRSRFGRVRHLPEVLSSTLPDWQLGRILRQAGNFPIQSAGADINNLAAIEVDRRLTEGNFKSIVFLLIHDSIMADVYPGEEKKVMKLCKDVMENYMMEIVGSWLKIPLQIDQEISERWAN